MTDTRDWHPVTSSAIDAIAHDDEGLHVRFKKGGAVHSYSAATRQHFDEMKAAESPGRYWQQNIRRGKEE